MVDMVAWVRAQAELVADHLSSVTPKTAASFNVASVLAVVVAMSLWQPGFSKRHEQAAAAPLAPQPVAVKMIDAAPRTNDCRQQTWPYIDRSCLNYGAPQPKSDDVAKAQPVQSGPPVAQLDTAPLVATIPSEAAGPASPKADVQRYESRMSDDVRVADDLVESEDFGPTEEELRAQARAEARQRRRAARRHHGHIWIGPFRF